MLKVPATSFTFVKQLDVTFVGELSFLRPSYTCESICWRERDESVIGFAFRHDDTHDTCVVR